MLDQTSYMPLLKQFEGCIPYMYLDTASKVTVGVGIMLPNASAAQALAFVVAADESPATADQIQAEFDHIAQQQPAERAGYYQQFATLKLPDPAIDAVLNQRMQDFLTTLTGIFPDYNSWPASACAAVFDMAFNLGTEKLTSAFPAFCRAVRNQDWATAAAQCHRLPPINADRNNWTRDQLNQAVTDAAATSAPAADPATASN